MDYISQPTKIYAPAYVPGRMTPSPYGSDPVWRRYMLTRLNAIRPTGVGGYTQQALPIRRELVQRFPTGPTSLSSRRFEELRSQPIEPRYVPGWRS